MSTCSHGTTVAVVGGGLAGLAAACALADAGLRVTLFERKPYLGGRASSYEHPGTGEVVDNCQHVLLGCCTNLLDLYHRIGAEPLIRWYDRLTFVEPGGRRSVIATGALPAPFHTAPSFLLASALTRADKLAITRALLAMLFGVPADTGQSFLQWLKAHGQTERAIERFWKVVLVSALNEELERMSVPAAAMVFRESFLKSAQGGRMGVPRVPLSALYARAGDYIAARGGGVELRSPVEELSVIPAGPPPWSHGFSPDQESPDTRNPKLETAPETRNPKLETEFASRPGIRLCVAGRPRMFDCAVLAIPFDGLARLLPQASESAALRAQLARFESSPITGVHLWYDRQITDLDHAVLLDRTIQWMFHKSRLLERADASAGNGQPATGNGSYVELVISACKSLVDKSRQEIIALATRELAEFFPAATDATLLKATVIKEVHATYSPLPGSDAHRPASATPWPGVFLAGDWTATGWPATMESAVRSGYLAAEALTAASGHPHRFLVPDLPATGLLRLLGK